LGRQRLVVVVVIQEQRRFSLRRALAAGQLIIRRDLG